MKPVGRPKTHKTPEAAAEAKNTQSRQSYEKSKAENPEKVKAKRQATNKAYYQKRKAQTQIFKENQMQAACEIAEEL